MFNRNLAANRARELFKPYKKVESLQASIKKLEAFKF